MFHGLASAHDRHSTDLALELDAIVGPTDGCCNHVLLHGQVVETFLYKQTNNTVGVEDEVGSVRVLVADDAVSGDMGQCLHNTLTDKSPSRGRT